jgi:hypothetical protein
MKDRAPLAAFIAVYCLVVARAPAADPPATSTEPTRQELLEQIKSLQSRVERLEAQQSAPSKAEVDATVAVLMRDAERRSQFMGDTPLAPGWENGRFQLVSEDRNYVLRPWLEFQLRNVTNFRNDAKASGGDDFENGFEIRRAKFGFDGNVFSPNTTYNINWATDRHDGHVFLELAWVRYQFQGPWAIEGGQFRDPFSHENLLSGPNQLTVDRSLMTDVFAGGDNYVQGVTALYQADNWHGQAAFTDGARNNFDQNFEDFPASNANFGVAGRIERKFRGDWHDYGDFTALGTKSELIVAGAGADFTQAGDTGIFLHTVDLAYEHPGGFSAYGSFMGRYTQDAPISATPAPRSDLYDWGILAQAGYLFRSHWEPYARYEFLKLDPDGLPAGSQNDVHVFIIGTNYYLHGQQAKFTVDFMWLPNGSPGSDDGSGILASDGKAEYILRGQFQLLL